MVAPPACDHRQVPYVTALTVPTEVRQSAPLHSVSGLPLGFNKAEKHSVRRRGCFVAHVTVALLNVYDVAGFSPPRRCQERLDRDTFQQVGLQQASPTAAHAPRTALNAADTPS